MAGHTTSTDLNSKQITNKNCKFRQARSLKRVQNTVTLQMMMTIGLRNINYTMPRKEVII